MTETTTAWLKLIAGVPEYARYDGRPDDISTLTEWYCEWDQEKILEAGETFQKWLHALPLGRVTPVPGHPGYRIVRVEYLPSKPAGGFDG